MHICIYMYICISIRIKREAPGLREQVQLAEDSSKYEQTNLAWVRACWLSHYC